MFEDKNFCLNAMKINLDYSNNLFIIYACYYCNDNNNCYCC